MSVFSGRLYPAN